MPKLVSYKDLRDCYYFKQNGRVYCKVSNAFAIDARTDKDAIFSLRDKVEPLYPANCSLL